ncbi:hypothetical protein ES689_07715 [Frigoribacterium sp. ACAM 257]|uniref:hypothetical protein n=1 Tax=Frigoribacterium sp. ACAM 257 TaxID=2508998 RepID=UPI0011B9CF2E|nr:hypothetical protein [Frigoribacterium sp. ACAM 257]TWX38512.1 hypothetical protein ES689_07715 [Frigoribacterium sp. ACAM 257]
MTTVRLNAFGLVTDGSEMSTIASDVTAAWTSLSSSLSGSAGMAGDDELAEDWSPDYDDSAKACANGTAAITSFLRSFDGLLAGTGAAYKEAELTGAGKPGTSGIEIPSGTTPSAEVPPSALGANPLPGGLGELGELIEGALYAVGVVFPRGDTDKLEAAAVAWGSFASDLDQASMRLGSSLVELAAADVPQSGVALDVRTALQEMMGDVSEAAAGNETALNDLAQNIDDTWAEIRSMLESLAIELAIDIGISVALSFVTFGVGALAGAAKATTTIARWVVKIADLIRKLKIINRIPADKFLRASSVLRKLEHGPMHWRFGAEVVKGTISGSASSVIVSTRNGEAITPDSLLATLAGGVVGGVAGGGVGAGFAAAFGRRAGRHAVQPTFFRATTTEAAKGAVEGAAGGVAGGGTEAAMRGEEFNVGLAALFGMGAGTAMGGGGHAVGAAIDARGGTGLGFDADAALAGRDGENVSPEFLADRRADAEDGGGLFDRGGEADVASPTTASETNGSPSPAPAGPAAAGGPAVGAGASVSTGVDAPAAVAGSGAGGGTSSAGGAGPVRTDVADVDTTSLPEAASSGDGTSQAASTDSTTPEATTVSASPESSASDSSPSDSTSTSESSTTPDTSTAPDLTATPESSATPDSTVTPDAATTPDSSTPEGAVTETSSGEATTSEAVSSDADATSASSIDTDLVTADELGISPESTGDASAIPTDSQLADVRSAIDADVAAHAEAVAAHAPPQGDTVAASPEATASPDASASATSATPESTTDGTPVDVPSSTRDDATLGEHATTADAAASSGADGSPSSHGDSIADAPPAAVGAASAAGATLLMARPTPLGTSGVPISDRAGHAAVDVARPRRAGGDAAAVGDASSRGGHDSDAGPATPTGSAPGSSSGRLPHYPESLVESEARAYRQALDAELSRHGLDRRSFRRLVSKPILKLSSHEMTTLIEIRESLPDIGPGSVLQKVLPDASVLSQLAGAQPVQDGVTGFIARFAHMTGASNRHFMTPRLVFQKLGLGYVPREGQVSSFDISSDERYAVRFELGPDPDWDTRTVDTMQPLRILSTMSRLAPDSGWDSMSMKERRVLVENNRGVIQTPSDAYYFDKALKSEKQDPFRGNGWAGQRGHYTPETTLAYGERSGPLREGAEIWRYSADGTQHVFAVLEAGRWTVL